MDCLARILFYFIFARKMTLHEIQTFTCTPKAKIKIKINK